MSDNTLIHREAFWLMCGEKIGNGIARTVYESRLLPGFVIKVEEDSRSFQNVLEWETWQRVRGTKHEKWFAPCESISAAGTVLVMRKTELARASEYPEKMPVFLTDFKRKNYGMYDGRLVCHDYGLTLLVEHGMTSRLRKANWWD